MKPTVVGVSVIVAIVVGIGCTTGCDDEGLVLHVVSADVADKYGGYCLDGSPPGYYLRTGAQKDKWRIHIRGGGWCWTASQCLSRAQSDLGSSLYFTEHFCDSPNIAEGFMNDNSTVNPFADWNLVFWMYCGGTSHTSNREEPLVLPNTQLWFRERNVVDVILDDLNQVGGLLETATEVVLTGTSAGALSTIMISSRVAEKLPKTTAFGVMPDSGYFLDYPSYQWGVYVMRNQLKNAIGPHLWNATGSVDPNCAAAHGDDLWMCFFPQYILPLVEDPRLRFFLPQSMGDSWQVENLLKLGCDPISLNCNSDQLDAFAVFEDALSQSIQQVVQQNTDTFSLFLTSCYQHGQTCSDPDWYDPSIKGLMTRGLLIPRAQSLLNTAGVDAFIILLRLLFLSGLYEFCAPAF
ncbi:Elongator complex protein 3 [Pelomyxa schiedti]|nr:Elongator complex protein 3 [Pelomyxa schiedti]